MMSSECRPLSSNPEEREIMEARFKRDVYTDMKIGIDALKAFDEKLNTLHPDVMWKIRRLINN